MKENNRENLLIGGVLIITCFIIFFIGRYWLADRTYNFGRLEDQAGRYQEAVKDMQRAIDLSPSEAIYRNEMARTLTNASIELLNEKESSNAARLSDYAVQESDLAFNLSPQNMTIRETRMGIYLQLAKINPLYLSLDEKFIKESLPLSPTDPKLLLLLGKVYANEGKINDAIIAFKKALDLKPDYDDAKHDLEIVQKLQGK